MAGTGQEETSEPGFKGLSWKVACHLRKRPAKYIYFELALTQDHSLTTSYSDRGRA